MVSLARFATQPRPTTASHQPGVCNIGPAEIARRRRSGHAGLIVSLGLLLALLAIDAPPIARILVATPATIAASGYLQAWLRFCAGYGWLGIVNFGELGRRTAIRDAAARALDRRRALQIGTASFVIGAGVSVLAVLLPI